MTRLRALIHKYAQKLANATRGKRMPYQPKGTDALDGIEHVVYEYSNFVYAHDYIEQHPAGGSLVIVVFNAFLLNSRQLADFFESPSSLKPDILAIHYSSNGRTALPVCARWRNAIDKQLAHISYSRVHSPEPQLSETQTRPGYLQ